MSGEGESNKEEVNSVGNSVGWFEIYVNDMDRAKKFYESVFKKQLENASNPDSLEESMEMFMFPGDMSSHGANGAIVKMSGCPAGQNSVIVYFSCNDCAIEESRVQDAGGSIQRGKFSIGEHGFISLVKDTEENIIGLHSMK